MNALDPARILRRMTGAERREQQRLARLIEESARRHREGHVEIPAQRDGEDEA